MNPVADRLLQAVAPSLAYHYIRLLRITMKCEYCNREAPEKARRNPGHYILAFWHSRFLMMPYGYLGRRGIVLLSRHRDARMLSRVLRRLGLEAAWGSSTAGGTAGLRAVVRKLRSGFDVGWAPDGPRGPRRRVKPGVIAAARLAGVPIVPVAFSAGRARRLRSWDRTLVPKVFSKGLFVYGDLLLVPRDADPAEQERLRLRLETELDRLTDYVDREVGLEPEEPVW